MKRNDGVSMINRICGFILILMLAMFITFCIWAAIISMAGYIRKADIVHHIEEVVIHATTAVD